MPVTNYASVNGQLVGETGPNGTIYYLDDALGSVRSTIDENNNVLNQYWYNPYGGLIDQSNDSYSPKFLWCGTRSYRQTGCAHSQIYMRGDHYSAQDACLTAFMFQAFVNQALSKGRSPYASRPMFAPIEGTGGFSGGGPNPCAGFTTTSCKVPGNVTITCRSQGNPKGETGCCAATGASWTLICDDDSCDCDCNRVHEAVHAQQLSVCCPCYSKCLNTSSAWAQSKCENAYDQWYDANKAFFECEAYKVSASCFEELVLNACWDSFGGCCASWLKGWKDDTAQMQSWCRKAGATQTPCPFNKNGTVSTNSSGGDCGPGSNNVLLGEVRANRK